MPSSLKSQRPRRILMTTDAVGGVWTYASQHARSLREDGFEVLLAVLGPPPGRRQSAEAHDAGAELLLTGLPLDWTATTPEQLDATALQLGELAATWHADLVHLHAPALAGSSRWRLPLVVSAHSCVATWWKAMHGAAGMPSDLAWRRRRTAAGLEVADAVIAPSRSFARDLAEEYGVSAIHCVHNGSDFSACGSAERRDIVLTAGRLWDDAKNAALIDAAAARSGLRICAAGSASEPSGKAVALPSIVLLGSLDRSEMARLYARTGIFVSASRYEPFGLAVLEAARCGAALVLSDIPAFRELWSGAALFFDPLDAGGLASALTHLAADRELRAALAARAEARAAQHTAARCYRRTLAFYEAARRRHRQPEATGARA